MARPLKARAIYDEMRHALGGDFSREMRAQDLLNDVLSEVTSMHEWLFLERGEAHVNLRGPIALSGWDWTASTLTLSDPATGGDLAGYSFIPTDLVQVTDGGTAGYYQVASKASDDSLTLAASISSGNLSGTVDGTLTPRVHLLPSDFRSLITAGFEDDNNQIRPETSEGVGIRQRDDDFRSYTYSYSVEWVSATQPALRITPVPEETQSGLAVVYKRRLAAVGDDGQNIDAPEWMHRLIKDVARDLALGLEQPDGGSFSDRLTRTMQGRVFLNAVAADGASQIDLGHVQGGHVPSRHQEIDSTNVIRSLSVQGPVTP